MDALLRTLTVFSISDTKSEAQFDEILSKMETLETIDSDFEWETLTGNYSKLRYLDHLMDYYHFPETEKFNGILIKALESIDKKNQYYLRTFDWGEQNEEIKEELAPVQQLFEKSLNTNIPSYKLTYTLEAYDILMPIIEEFRKEKFIDHFDNEIEFVKELNRLKKRRRID